MSQAQHGARQSNPPLNLGCCDEANFSSPVLSWVDILGRSGDTHVQVLVI